MEEKGVCGVLVVPVGMVFGPADWPKAWGKSAGCTLGPLAKEAR